MTDTERDWKDINAQPMNTTNMADTGHKHHFEFVKTEYTPIPGGTAMELHDLVICSECGETRRI